MPITIEDVERTAGNIDRALRDYDSALRQALRAVTQGAATNVANLFRSLADRIARIVTFAERLARVGLDIVAHITRATSTVVSGGVHQMAAALQALASRVQAIITRLVRFQQAILRRIQNSRALATAINTALRGAIAVAQTLEPARERVYRTIQALHTRIDGLLRRLIGALARGANRVRAALQVVLERATEIATGTISAAMGAAEATAHSIFNEVSEFGTSLGFGD
ncbi:MAG: hypothetical protein AAGI17_00310 [Planctomycetota bacterium]